VITRGGRVQETIDIVEGQGGTVAAIAVLVDRSGDKARFNYPLVSLLRMEPVTHEPARCPFCAKGVPSSIRARKARFGRREAAQRQKLFGRQKLFLPGPAVSCDSYQTKNWGRFNTPGWPVERKKGFCNSRGSYGMKMTHCRQAVWRVLGLGVLFMATSSAKAQTLRFDEFRAVQEPDNANIRLGPFYSDWSIALSAGYRYVRSSGAGSDLLYADQRAA